MTSTHTQTPATMHAIEITQPGGPEVLSLGDRPTPEPAQQEVLIKVHAAGVNRPDVVQRMGHYPPPPGASDIPGLEVAGEVVALGNKVKRYVVGDKVCALVTGGGYAEYVNAHELLTLPVPAGLTLIEAAGVPETFFTVWHNLFQRAALKPGESCLVHGGSSGIGTTAIQMAHLMGARVYTTAGSPEKCQTCRELGAELAINYREQDFVEVLKAQSRGMDVILDMVGGDYIQRNMKVAAVEGRIVSIAFLRGAQAEVNFNPMLLKRLTLMGSTLRAQSVESKARIAEELALHIWPLIEAGKIKPLIDSIYPLAQASKAHQRLESSTHTGKIILSG